ncbi:hypothetical protein Sango_2759500 [Sesamum angolense]|uniref:Retrotransposon protein, putative, Ty1-copia subclass n=1 Tax=Sesamum angolense TaxID=2727404 RepID=A0AAE1VYH7_9LAMI|nr:hypothetical protein Sango_2759500 [Sesamum angolense]
MVPRRFEDSSTSGAYGETMILGVSITGSVDLGAVVVADPERGVNGVLETTCRACYRAILEKEELDGANFLDWETQLGFFLKQEKKIDVLDAQLPAKPADDASATTKTAYETRKERSQDVACLMLLSMVPELQKQFEDMEAYDTIIQLKAMFGYANFVVNYHMNNLDKIVHELLGMLKAAGKSIKDEQKKNVLMIQKKKSAIKKGGNKNKKKVFGNKKQRLMAIAKPWRTLEEELPKVLEGLEKRLSCFNLRGGYNYFITFTDDLSGYGYAYLMKHKSKVFEKFKEFQNDVQNQLANPSWTPHNGISECKNMTSLEMSEMESTYDNKVWNLVDLLEVVKNILKYLKRTKDYFLTYGGDYVLCVKGAISLKSSKQNTVVDYTNEAEYIAAAKAAKEAAWIKNFIYELGVVPSVASPNELYCDNNGAIIQAKKTYT